MTEAASSYLEPATEQHMQYMPVSIIAKGLLPTAIDAPFETFSNVFNKLRSLDFNNHKNQRRVRMNKLSPLQNSPIVVHKPHNNRLPRRAWSPFVQSGTQSSDDPKDIDMGQATRIASIRIDPAPIRRIRARFRIEVPAHSAFNLLAPIHPLPLQPANSSPSIHSPPIAILLSAMRLSSPDNIHPSLNRPPPGILPAIPGPDQRHRHLPRPHLP
jgi:hypothetical protein